MIVVSSQQRSLLAHEVALSWFCQFIRDQLDQQLAVRSYFSFGETSAAAEADDSKSDIGKILSGMPEEHD